MKIIQIVTGIEGDASDTDHNIYGLGDDGNLYIYYAASRAGATIPDGTFTQKFTTDCKEIQLAQADKEQHVHFRTGRSNGWQLMATSEERSEVLYHPFDPARPL